MIIPPAKDYRLDIKALQIYLSYIRLQSEYRMCKDILWPDQLFEFESYL